MRERCADLQRLPAEPGVAGGPVALDHSDSQAAAQGLAITDEASAMEAQGLAPRLVPGSAQNFKITYPEDFSLAEAVLSARAAPGRTP